MTLIRKHPDLRDRIHIVPAEGNLVGQRFSSYVRHLAGMTRVERLKILRDRAHELLGVYGKQVTGSQRYQVASKLIHLLIISGVAVILLLICILRGIDRA